VTQTYTIETKYNQVIKHTVMIRQIYMVVAGIIAIALTSCNEIIKIKTSEDSPVITKEISLNGTFNGLVTECSADIEYTDGPAKITLSAPEDILDILEIMVKDGKLIISTKDSVRQCSKSRNFQIGLNSNGNIRLIVSYPEINNFTTSGSGDIKIGDIEREGISLLAQGSGDIECGTLNSTGLSILTQGSGDITVSNAECRDISLTTQGSGDIKIKEVFSTTLSALSQGSGDIDIAGESKHAELSTMGSGDINAESLKCSSLRIKKIGVGDVNAK